MFRLCRNLHLNLRDDRSVRSALFLSNVLVFCRNQYYRKHYISVRIMKMIRRSSPLNFLLATLGASPWLTGISEKSKVEYLGRRIIFDASGGSSLWPIAGVDIRVMVFQSGLLGVFQKLIASKSNDHEGFYLLGSMVEHMSK